MKRGILIGLLVVGVVAGLSVGFCRLGHTRWRDHDDFEDRIAETCSEATLRVLDRERGHHRDWDRDRPPHDRDHHHEHTDGPPEPPPAMPPPPGAAPPPAPPAP